MSSRLLALVLASLACSCATAAKPRPVDLQPARQALEEARAGGAAERAPETFTRAEGELQKAERLVAESGPDAPVAATQAEWVARLALAEARCAARDAANEAAHTAADQARRLELRAQRSEDDQRRLEEQLALRQRELEFTQAELIRTKGRLKGLETRAEASSAIAEASILVERARSRGRAATAKVAKDSLDNAVRQLDLSNFGAALFFALRAQDVVTKATEGARSQAATEPAEAAGPERPAPQPTYVVSVDSANIRQSPSTMAAVVGEAARGTTLKALAVRGPWVKVVQGDVTGWVSLKLLQ
jgi:hypothetical protein